MIYALQLLGVVAFAASGVMASRSKRPDVVGAFILAFVTALGGGVIRDAILGRPAQSFRDDAFLVAIAVGALLAMALPRVLQRITPTLRVADAFGLGLFNATGTAIALQSGEVSAPFAVLLGAATGAGGGILRDVLCGEMPALLQPGEVYITTCLVGGATGLTVLALGASMSAASAVIAAVTIALRLAAIRFGWRFAPLEGR